MFTILKSYNTKKRKYYELIVRLYGIVMISDSR